jgi:hypothetical protein
MSHETYQPSDLAGAKRTQFLQDARGGRARLRDKDGVTLVMLPEQDLDVLDNFAKWSMVQQRIASLAERTAKASVLELGDLAWVRVFDQDDLATFSDELHGALITALADKDTDLIEEVVGAWRITARQLEDPLRRSVLTSAFRASDFVDASAPE